MKERPILFSGPMVRAILAGHKTQTRRLRELDGINANPDSWQYDGPHKSGTIYDGWHAFRNDSESRVRLIKCPYGIAGDGLWVKETWGTLPGWDEVLPSHVVEAGPRNAGAQIFRQADGRTDEVKRWRPSIHMPRHLSRTTSDVTAVCVERLNEISEEDAEAEGAMHWWNGLDVNKQAEIYTGGRGPIEAFRMLWDSINSKRGFGWIENPWVWAISFKRVEARQAAA